MKRKKKGGQLLSAIVTKTAQKRAQNADRHFVVARIFCRFFVVFSSILSSILGKTDTRGLSFFSYLPPHPPQSLSG